MAMADPVAGDEVRLATNAMATRFELVLQGADRVRLRAAGEAAIEVIEEAHRVLTRFESSSLLSHLRRVAPRLVTVDGDTLALFLDLDRLVADSEGSFDPTGGSGWIDVVIDQAGSRVGLATATTALDLGAIAKGHAIDLAVASLRASGVVAAFVHGGTSSGYGLGRPIGGEPWTIRLAGGPSIPLVDVAYSVSSSVQQRDGLNIGHLIDPRSGSMLSCRRKVAIVAPSARLADGWTTAAVVLGRRPTGMPGGWRMWMADGADDWKELD